MVVYLLQKMAEIIKFNASEGYEKVRRRNDRLRWRYPLLCVVFFARFRFSYCVNLEVLCVSCRIFFSLAAFSTCRFILLFIFYDAIFLRNSRERIFNFESN